MTREEIAKEVADGIDDWFPDEDPTSLLYRPADIRDILKEALAKPFWTLSIDRDDGITVSLGSLDLLAPASLGEARLEDLIPDLIELHSAANGQVDQTTLAKAADELERHASVIRNVIQERGADLGGWDYR